jgi:O-antigen ligase
MTAEHERLGTLVRFVLWNAAYQGILENPLFGNGPGAESELFQMERHGGFHHKLARDTGEIKPRAPHNSYLSIALQGGVVALALFFLFILFYAMSIYRRFKQIKRINPQYQYSYFGSFFICSLLSLMNILIGALFSGAIWMNLVWFIFGLSLAGVSVFQIENRDQLFTDVRLSQESPLSKGA